MTRLVSALLHEIAKLLRRRPRGRRAALAASVGIAGTLTGALLVASAFVARGAAPFLYSRLEDVPARAVAIVPGCRAYPDGTPSPMLEDRLATALAAYEARKVRKILVSGDGTAPGRDEITAMRAWLEARGVPRDDLLDDGEGLRTLETMARARRVFGVTSAIACTQEFHLARSVYLARSYGIDAVGLAADRRVYAGIRYDRLRETYARAVACFEVRALRKGAAR
jgi:SanA protein